MTCFEGVRRPLFGVFLFLTVSMVNLRALSWRIVTVTFGEGPLRGFFVISGGSKKREHAGMNSRESRNEVISQRVHARKPTHQRPTTTTIRP